MKRIVITIATLALCVSVVSAADSPQSSLAWRQVGAFSGAPIAEKTASYAAGLGASSVVRPTVNGGVCEVKPVDGQQVVATEPWGLAWPVMTAPMGISPAAAFDLPIRWVYETDNLVTGEPFAELGQTFVATSGELARIACFIATGPDDFEITIRRDGPKGDQVGPSASFAITADQPMGVARWNPGDVPLDKWKTYYVGIKSKTGKKFATRLHSTGDSYPDGIAYQDGVPESGSDLGLLITLQSDSAVRSSVVYSTRGDGWVLHSKGVYFKAKSANVRAAYVRVKGKNLPATFSALMRCSKLNPDSTTVPIGPEKTCAAVVTSDGEYAVAAVFGPGEVPTEPGQTYYLEVILKGEGVPADAKPDILADIYGEKTPGMTPVIYNQKITATASTSVAVSWSGTAGAKTRVNYGLTPSNLGFVIGVPKGEQKADIHPIRPGQRFFFKITAQTQSGGSFETPVYVTRTFDAQNKPVTDPPLPATPREDFLALAPMDELFEPTFDAPKKVVPVEVANSAFEDGVKGWQILPEKSADVSSIASDGKFAAGWDSASPAAGQFPKESAIYQTVDVTPGKWYVLSAYLKTDQPAPATDLWARLICDPKGGTDFTGFNSTQWLRTGGKWMKFSKYWKAAGRTMNLGVGFTRGDGKYVAALADSVTLVEVRESPFLKRLIGK